MKHDCLEKEVIVHPVDGMQLSAGCIRVDASRHFYGYLPGIEPAAGGSIEEVLRRLERKAKAYYGDDVVVEITRVSF